MKHYILYFLKDFLEKVGKSLLHFWHSVISAILSCREQQQIILTTFRTPSFFDQWSLMSAKALHPLLVSTAVSKTPLCLVSKNIKVLKPQHSSLVGMFVRLV